jgi:hypothetical protein
VVVGLQVENFIATLHTRALEVLAETADGRMQHKRVIARGTIDRVIHNIAMYTQSIAAVKPRHLYRYVIAQYNAAIAKLAYLTSKSILGRG